MKSMKGNPLPKEHFEKKVADISCCNEKYASKSTMENPEDLKRSADALASYMKKNKMKY